MKIDPKNCPEKKGKQLGIVIGIIISIIFVICAAFYVQNSQNFSQNGEVRHIPHIPKGSITTKSGCGTCCGHH